MSDVDAILAHAAARRADSRARWFDLLRIPSVSAQPPHAADCRRAAEWVRAELAGMGFTAAVRETAGHPVVVAHHPGPTGSGPHLLYYGHYDVQPPEPLDLWTSPPFEPALTEGPNGPRVVARGAVDDKGQTMTWLEALRFWHEAAGGPPCRVSVLVEGEEEIGSRNLPDFLEANAEELRADIAVVSDTNMWDVATPAISTRLRGMLYTQLDITAANRDLHSGLFGGSALNPINLLTRILGDLKDEGGEILIPGFYDEVPDLPDALRRQWDALGFDEAAFLGGIGLSVPAGEVGRSALERLWARPTADVNGIWGGYTGEGSKTVIPSQAHAKVSFRLVPGQTPAKVLAGFRDFIVARLPEDAQVKIQVFSMSEGIEVPPDSAWVVAAAPALEAVFGKAPVLMGCGGSIPVVSSMKTILGMDSLLVGFGLEDDQVHGPNEKFDVSCFERGIDSHIRMLDALSKVRPA
ncbi:M20/M25/M40 family metallo-hydrolase [Roseomonas sp. CECT 9278]|uniref:M20/M25/M40 family metallo-hydrolase n=1 Tax=Roseomonas sp. CECT 9278 TaxID=2845823 RepID=UPI001E624F4F|nr:M20/M25/M40 family metallo-hydrolase [Roseomonas sp. CECT 9278]CAH0304942.1 Succinyl-diaminopimelate desuccinylase [Roseomonas sp. CECT 9278]